MTIVACWVVPKIINFVEWVEIKNCFIKKNVFWGWKGFHRVLLLRYCKNKKWKRYFLAGIFYIIDIHIYVLDFIQKNREFSFAQLYVSTYMSLNAGMELPIWKGNGHVFSSSVLNAVLFWNCSSDMGAQTFLPPKMIFLYFHSA